MFCSVVPIRDTHKSPKIVCSLRTPSVEAPNWKDTDHHRCSHRLVRNAAFLNRMFHRHSTRNLHVMLPIILLLLQKVRYLYVILRFDRALSRLDLVQDFRYGFALVKMIFYTLDLLIILMPLCRAARSYPLAFACVMR